MYPVWDTSAGATVCYCVGCVKARSEGIVKLHPMESLLMNIVSGLANAALGYVFALQTARMVLSHLRWRKAVRTYVKSELEALNSPTIFRLPLEVKCEFSSFAERGGMSHPLTIKPKQRYLRSVHMQFCAKWARAAKARFLYVGNCQDTAVNRAAVHRFFLQEWKAIGIPLHKMDVYMLDAIEMAFEPTHEFYALVSRRKQKKWGRMEFYNEKKALSAIR